MRSLFRRGVNKGDDDRLPKPDKDPSLAINDLWIYRHLVPSAADVLRRFLDCPAPRVITSSRLVLKYGLHMELSEAQAINFVSKNTTVPVPRVITAFQSRKDGQRYILMTRCAGDSLGSVFWSLSEEAKRNVLAELRGYIDQLRDLKALGPRVGAVDYTPISDHRIQSLPCGPYPNVESFHDALRDGHKGHTGHEELDALIAAHEGRTYDIKFTHGDLSFRNIVFDGRKITGIVDWETSGWFPDYWEYAQTWDSFWDAPDKDCLNEFLEPYPEQRDMELLRRRLFRPV